MSGMITIDLQFRIHSYWHVGTGHGDGAAADSVALRDAVSQLPYVPGRQVKGLLRDAVDTADQVGLYPRRGLATEWFGSPIDRGDEPEHAMASGRYTTTQAGLRVESAVLGRGEESRVWNAWAANSAAEVATLFRPFASTKLDERGVAADKTLRSLELVVPMTLWAQVSGPGTQWPEQLARALPFIDGIGGHRTRGLGRVTVNIPEGATR